MTKLWSGPKIGAREQIFSLSRTICSVLRASHEAISSSRSFSPIASSSGARPGIGAHKVTLH
jgi:hypothetical protein